MKAREAAGGGLKPGQGPLERPAPGDRPADEKAPRRFFDSVRENVEAVVVAVVLALIIRHFSVEAFEIPTGSMAPTLFGIHAWAQCPNCDTEFNVGLGASSLEGDLRSQYGERLVYWGSCPRCKLPHHRTLVDGREVQVGESFVCPHDETKWTGKASDFLRRKVYPRVGNDPKLQCPICWYRFHEVITRWNKTGGHKILVNKATYQLRPPERWDVIVFQFDREQNYIKRLIGKPGERVALRGGDVFINGRIERKHTRPEVQEVLWTKIHDLDVPEKGYQKLPAWKEVFPPGQATPAGAFGWDAAQRRFSVNVGPGKTAALRYQRPIVNFYSYNLLRSPGSADRQDSENQVGDKKVTFQARTSPRSRGWVGAEMSDAGYTFQVRIPIGRPDPANPATLKRLPADPDPQRPSPDRAPLPEGAGGLSASAAVALPPDSLRRVEFENLDDRVAVRLDGQEVLSLEYDGGGESARSVEENTLLLLAGDGAACDVESIQVHRDIYYTANGKYGVTKEEDEVKLAANGYFPCGDNSPASLDGRYWHSVPERSLMGKALLVFWPLWPTNWQFKFIR